MAVHRHALIVERKVTKVTGTGERDAGPVLGLRVIAYSLILLGRLPVRLWRQHDRRVAHRCAKLPPSVGQQEPNA